MRCRTRHWITRQRQFVEQWAWRSGGGHQLYARPTRRNLYLHGWTADVDRARARCGGAAQARKIEEEAGGDLNAVPGKPLILFDAFSSREPVPTSLENALFSRSPRHTANSRSATLPRPAARRWPHRREPC